MTMVLFGMMVEVRGWVVCDFVARRQVVEALGSLELIPTMMILKQQMMWSKDARIDRS
jgi:hypothetical protein